MTILLCQYRRLIPAILLGLATVGAQAAIARPVLNKPIYNPESKSYFELVQDLLTNGTQGPSWGDARRAASKRYFKGVQGHLAVIRSAQTEMFLATRLRSDKNTWFGLFYDCKLRNLEWVTGETFKKGSYANWDPIQWNIGNHGEFCPGGTGIMPALIQKTRYWAMQLSGKRYNAYLVEYSTGGVNPVATKQKADEAAAADPDVEKGSQNEE